MGPDVPLTFSLPNALDEGNCPLALIHFLVDRQNTLAQLLDEYFLLQRRDRNRDTNRGRDRDRDKGEHQEKSSSSSSSSLSGAGRVSVVSSRFLTPAHTICCDLHTDLIPLLEKHCLLPSSYSSASHGSTGGGSRTSTSDGSGGAGGGKYDFAKAERLLVERLLLDVPAVDLEMPGFSFKNEQHLQGTW
jgi:hypothetical protein